MAENKKSTVFYCDYINIFEELSDEEAGRLIKHYLRYVNDLNPDPPERLIKIIFEPIRLQLKRDLVKWEKSLNKKSAAGNAGAISRFKHKIDLGILTGKIELERELIFCAEKIEAAGGVDDYFEECRKYLIKCKDDQDRPGPTRTTLIAADLPSLSEILNGPQAPEKTDNKRFIPPTIDDVNAYFTEKRNYDITIDVNEGSVFFHFYDSKNWFVGKNKMKNWRAAVSGWISRKKINLNNSQSLNNGTSINRLSAARDF